MSLRRWGAYASAGLLAAAVAGTAFSQVSAKKLQPPPPTPSGHVAAGNRPPEFEYPPYHRAAPGQKVSFGLHVVDPDSDTVSVDLVKKPATAQYDPLTLTVTWKPTAKDAPAGDFTAKVTETPRAGGEKRAYTFDFSIAVDAKTKEIPAPQPLGPAVEELITIHDADRLKQVNADWPLARTLQTVAKMQIAKLPEADRAKAKEPDTNELYKTILSALSRVHQNPRLDPTSKSFDKAFADPSKWKIVTIRPRLDKKVQELRIVYQAVEAPEPVYLMFRFRLAKDVPDLPPEQAEANNKEISRLALESFFTGGSLNPKFDKDKKAHGKAVSAFVTAILTYKNDKLPDLAGEFVALPHEARMGGGSARSGGAYASGDGWAWAVLKPVWTDGKLAFNNVPIPGFTTDVRPSADGSKWQTMCAPKFDPDDPAHTAGYEVLCRKKLGFTDLPARDASGKIVPGNIDATNLYVDHKLGDEVAIVDLRDPRRDLFEENGMTCSQCHVRDFANGDPRDAATRDPRQGRLPAASPAMPTTFFNIVPEESWRPFTLEFQRFQECLTKDALKKFGGVDTTLTCPLVQE